MTQVGEGIAVAIIKLVKSKYIFAAIKEVTFESGIDIYDVEKTGTEKQLPPAGTPHWGASRRPFPAVYVREGGAGETKELKVKVEWNQEGCDGSAKLEGESSDGKMKIEGDFNISGARGEEIVNCTFTKKPDVVANYRRRIRFEWKVTAGGETATAAGGSPLKLFFVDQEPKPFAWAYKRHYLKVIDWATEWAEGKQGSSDVLDALWSEFSDGAGARVPHAMGFSYWKTGDPVQDLKSLITPDGVARKKGMSCRAIAHMFMECLALNGMRCVEVIPYKAPGTHLFLVENWGHDPSPVPNWPTHPTAYYGGSWISSDRPPLSKQVPTSHGLTIDFRKEPGVPGQGQRKPPLGFQNHWIVEHNAKLYDTSYGAEHPNDINTYANSALAGWLVDAIPDSYKTGILWWVKTEDSDAWMCRVVSLHSLQRADQASN